MSNNLGEEMYGLTVVLQPGGITTGATATELKFASAFDYTIDGIFYNKASGDFAITGSDVTNLASAQSCVLGVWVGTATATVTVNQGPIVSRDALTAGTTVLYLPEQLPNKALAGLVRVTTNSAATFTFGTTAPTAAGVTMAYSNTIMMPAKPYTAAS